MITIYEQSFNSQTQQIQIDGNILKLRTIDCLRGVFGDTREINLSKLNKGSEYNLCRDRFGYTSLVFASFALENIEKALVFYIPDEDNGISNMLIHSFSPVEVLSPDRMITERISDNVQFKLYDAIVQIHPSYASKVHAMLMHHMLEENISVSLSLSCMDAQLEMITKMLMVIVDTNPDIAAAIEKAMPNIADIRKAIEDTSLLNIKNNDKLLKEINQKKYIRSVQESYYKLKSSLFETVSPDEDKYPEAGVDLAYKYDPAMYTNLYSDEVKK